jgi:hypothetical protein
MCPTAAAVASLNLPSTPDAKFQHPAKCLKANIHRAFCHVHPIKSPTRLPEDPEFETGTLLLLIGVLIGFLGGYGVREWISRRRHAAAEMRRLARRIEHITNPEGRRGDGFRR